MTIVRRLMVSVVFAAYCLSVTSVRSQNEIPTAVTVQNRAGELPFSSSIGTSIEHVDAATGGLNVRIPIGSVPGRGMNAGLYLQFNSNYFLLALRVDHFGEPSYQWTIPVNSRWQTNHSYLSSVGQNITCMSPPGGSYTVATNFIYYDEDGGQHPLAIQQITGAGSCAGITDSPNPDLSALGMSATPSSVTLSNGTQLNPIFNVGGGADWKDQNGNQKAWTTTGSTTATQGNFTTDTLGRPFFTSSSTTDGSGNPLTTTYTVKDSTGTPQNYVANWQLVNYNTNFANTTGSGPEHEIVGGSSYVISSILLPNGKSYGFKYDTVGYGEITEIDLPTGGVITYTYANIENVLYTRRAVASRTETVNGVSSTWTFSIVPSFGLNSPQDDYTSTVTYPAVGSPAVQNQSVFLTASGSIYDAKIYAGSATGTPLREYLVGYGQDPDPFIDDACYNNNGAGDLPPLQSEALGTRLTGFATILENGQQSQTTFSYDSISYVYHPNHCNYSLSGQDSKVARTYTTSRGNVTDKYEYDWGREHRDRFFDILTTIMAC